MDIEGILITAACLWGAYGQFKKGHHAYAIALVGATAYLLLANPFGGSSSTQDALCGPTDSR